MLVFNNATCNKTSGAAGKVIFQRVMSLARLSSQDRIHSRLREIVEGRARAASSFFQSMAEGLRHASLFGLGIRIAISLYEKLRETRPGCKKRIFSTNEPSLVYSIKVSSVNDIQRVSLLYFITWNRVFKCHSPSYISFAISYPMYYPTQHQHNYTT